MQRLSDSQAGGTRAGRGIDWTWLYGHLVTSTGWTIAYIKTLTMPDVVRLCSYWRQHPPLHVLVAACLGHGGNDELSSEQAAQLASYLGPPRRMPPHISELMNWAEQMKDGTLDSHTPGA